MKFDLLHCIPTKQNEMKFDWKNFISFDSYKSFQRSFISFGNFFEKIEKILKKQGFHEKVGQI